MAPDPNHDDFSVSASNVSQTVPATLLDDLEDPTRVTNDVHDTPGSQIGGVAEAVNESGTESPASTEGRVGG